MEIMTIFDVAVFVQEREKGKVPMITAYTIWYSEDWPGYNKIQLEARNGTEAKKLAKRIVRERYKNQDPELNIAPKQ